MSLAITTLVENTVNVPGLKGEHGLAFLVRMGDETVLFDTGQTALLLDNAEKMKVSLERLKTIVLSHAHYDHTGGLSAVSSLCREATLVLHPDAVEPKFSKLSSGGSRPVGMNVEAVQTVKRAEAAGRLLNSKKPVQVAPKAWVTGEIPRATTYEDTGGPFYRDAACRKPDPLLDDQAMFFETAEGTVVLLGCSHAGVVNTLQYIKSLTGDAPFRAVMGGMHLLAAGAERMARTVERLKAFEIRQMIPAHCTGISATAELWQNFGSHCSACPVGTTFHFDYVHQP